MTEIAAHIHWIRSRMTRNAAARVAGCPLERELNSGRWKRMGSHPMGHF